MKLAIFSDIHGNFTAWQEAFSIMKTQQVDQLLCVGDIVGYGPRPNQVINHLRDQQQSGLDIKLIQGNHDHGLINEQSRARFNHQAQQSLRWTAEQLSSENKQFLAQLPQTWQRDELLLAHGTPDNPLWDYLRKWNAPQNFSNHQFQYCFVGHTHLLQAFTTRPDSSEINSHDMVNSKDLTIDTNQRAIINVGSIGQPRDHNPHGSFILWDSEQNTITTIRFEYDISTTQQLIYESKLPDWEADRLAQGR